MSHSVFSLRGVMALAFTLVSACGGGGGPGFLEPPPIPKANLVASATTIRLGESITLTGSCTPVAAASSSTKSWPSPSPSASMNFSEVVTPTSVGVVKYTLTCVGSSGSSTAEVSVTVLPLEISGKFVTYNSGIGSLGGLRVYTTSSAGVDSSDVNPDGSWSVGVKTVNDTALTLSADAKDVSNRKLFRWEINLPKSRWNDNLLYTLVPIEWQFPSGTYVGQSRTVSLHWDAFNPTAPAGVIAPTLINVAESPVCWEYRLETWSTFPVPVAFDRERSDDPFGPADSAKFWERITRVEVELGWDAWRPANFSEMSYVPPDAGGKGEKWSGVLVRAKFGQSNGGSGVFNTSGIISGSVNLAVFAWGFRAAPHEMIHTLNIGHSSWQDMMMGFGASNSQDPIFQSPGTRTTSVIQLLYTDGGTVRSMGEGARSGIPGSHMGERRILGGLSLKPNCKDLF